MSKLKMGKAGKQMLIENVVAYWAKVDTPAPKYKDPENKEYSIEVLIPEDIVDALEDYSINKSPTAISQKNKKSMKKKGELAYPETHDDLFALKLASPATWPDGKEKNIKVIKDGKPFSDAIGNESIVSVIVRIGKENQDGLKAVYLESVNVIELVEYEGSSEFDFEEDSNTSTDEDDDLDF